MKPICRVLPFVVLILLAGYPVEGQQGGSGGASWRINFIPYYWGPDLDVKLGLAGLEQRAEERFLEESGVFKPNVFGVAFGAVRGSWGCLFEGEALDSDFDFDLPDGRLGTVELESQRLGLGLLYQWHQSLYEGSDLFVTPWVGLRYRHMSLRLVDTASQEGGEPGEAVLDSDGSHWVEPMAGLRAQWSVTPEWSVSAAGSVEGISQDQTAFSASGWLKYLLSKEINIGIGYRFDEFDFGGGSGDSLWAADGKAQGIVVGVEFDYYAVRSEQGGSWGHLASLTPPERRSEEKPIPPGTIQEDMDGVAAPKEDENWLERSLDRGHEIVNRSLDGGVESINGWMLDDDRPRVSRKKSRFFLALDTRVIEEADSGSTLEVRPSVDARLNLPNLENRIKLALTSTSVDEMPGTDPFDRETGLNLGLVTDGLVVKRMKFKAGIRSSLDGYTSLSWRPQWTRASWRISPEARLYYRTDRGEGVVGSLGMGYSIKDRYRAAFLPSVEYGKGTDWELEWLTNLSFAYIFEGDDEDQHRALFTNISVSGTWEDGTRSYRWTPISYRAPLYKKWLYWELGPEIVWREIDDWEPEPTIRFAVSSLFWGTSER